MTKDELIIKANDFVKEVEAVATLEPWPAESRQEGGYKMEPEEVAKCLKFYDEYLPKIKKLHQNILLFYKEHAKDIESDSETAQTFHFAEAWANNTLVSFSHLKTAFRSISDNYEKKRRIAEITINRDKNLQPVDYGIMHDKTVLQIIAGKPTRLDGNILGWQIIQDRGNTQRQTRILLQDKIGRPSDPPTAFDISVLTAIAALCRRNGLGDEKNKLPVTIKEVFQALNHIENPQKEDKPTALQAKEIQDSIERMFTTRITINYQEELNCGTKFKTWGKGDDMGERVTWLLKGEWQKQKINGQLVKNGFVVEEIPLLYMYNHEKGTISHIKNSLLNTTKHTGKDIGTAAIKEYFACEIEQMKTGYRDSNTILIDTIYTKLNMQRPEDKIRPENYENTNAYNSNLRKRAQQDRKLFENILKAFSENNFISGYEVKKQGRLITGYTIIDTEIQATKERKAKAQQAKKDKKRQYIKRDAGQI